MEVYAEYYKLDNGQEYRKKTLLRFGNDTKLIGSAVLMNPGSAERKGEPDSKFIESFYSENHQIKEMDLENWERFDADSTMRQLEKIFNGWYVGKQRESKRELNGVIQLFNCFYFKNQNCGEAIKNYDEKSDYNFNESQFFLDKPVYFGWGDEGKSGKLKPIATDIFSNYELNKTPIYDSKFEKNCFYHPGYVNRSYGRNAKTQQLMNDFFELIQ